MSSPEANAEPSELTGAPPYGNGNGTRDEDRDEEKGLVTSSPGEMSEVEDGGTHDEEDDEGDSEDEEEDDDEEPALKYERIGGALNDLLKKDSASALAISNRLMVSTTYTTQTKYPIF